jgi:tryptophan synthase alpha chain
MVEFQTRVPQHPEPIIEAIAEATRDLDITTLLWADDPTVLDFGLRDRMSFRLIEACVAADISGIVAPIPYFWVEPWIDACGDEIAPVFFVAPDTESPHVRKACDAVSTGFLYLVGFPPLPVGQPEKVSTIAGTVDSLREMSGSPVFLGAGIATPQQAAVAATVCDGVAVAKGVRDTLERAFEREVDTVAAVAGLVRELRASLTLPAPN